MSVSGIDREKGRTHPPRRHAAPAGPSGWLLACALLAGCASQATRQEESTLPFHVALLPVEVTPREGGRLSLDEHDQTDQVLSFDSEALSRDLASALDRGCFSRATLLSAAPTEAGSDAYGAWLVEAQEQGADLILDVSLSYDPAIHTALNGQFWLNLPLFLLGGPFNWFVNDRSYFVDVRIEATLYDVATASRAEIGALDSSARVARVDLSQDETSLDFLDRADGVGHYALSLLVPSGLLARGSDAVPGELEAALSDDLAQRLRSSIQEHVFDIRASELVDFFPEGERIVEAPEGRFLEGQMVLELGDVSELGELRYRIDSGAAIPCAWGPDQIDRGPRRAVRRYPFRIPLGDLPSGNVQLEVQQLDRFTSTRTFTYMIPPRGAQ